MKKITFIMSLALVMTLSACGGGASDICSCKKTMEEMAKEMEAAGSDQAKAGEIATKYAKDIQSCDELTKGKSPEELGKEMEACK